MAKTILERLSQQFGKAGDEPIIVSWPTNEAIINNWGDKLNPVLVGHLSGRAAVNRDNAPKGASSYFVIGSGLESVSDRDVVWGSGFIRRDPPHVRRPKICAVRGPLSRSLFLAAGCSCPEIYGDPALLMPLFYNPQISPSYDIGLIQHCREIDCEPLPLLPSGLSVHVIDINGGIEEVIDAILSCRRILSSSLHGVIASHAYGVPAAWIKLSDRPIGDGTKFRDYWASMGRDDVQPLQVAQGMVIDPEIGISTPGTPLVDLFALIEACPFIGKLRKAELRGRAYALREEGLPRGIFRIHAGLDRPAH